jgi:hypothetical protein
MSIRITRECSTPGRSGSSDAEFLHVIALLRGMRQRMRGDREKCGCPLIHEKQSHIQDTGGVRIGGATLAVPGFCIHPNAAESENTSEPLPGPVRKQPGQPVRIEARERSCHSCGAARFPNTIGSKRPGPITSAQRNSSVPPCENILP